MSYSDKRIITALLGILLACQLAGAREYKLSVSKLKSLNENVEKPIGEFTVQLGRVYKSGQSEKQVAR